jgi:gentisate 1,2-dioxygenase
MPLPSPSDLARSGTLEELYGTAPYRTTANNIFAVVQGEGASTVDGERFEWRRGDVIAAPAWRPHWHEATDDAMLLRVTDEPVMQRFGWWREEPPTQ